MSEAIILEASFLACNLSKTRDEWHPSLTNHHTVYSLTCNSTVGSGSPWFASRHSKARQWAVKLSAVNPCHRKPNKSWRDRFPGGCLERSSSATPGNSASLPRVETLDRSPATKSFDKNHLAANGRPEGRT